MKRTIKQALRSLRDNPVLSTVGILGTALAIAMIMDSVMSWQLDTAPFYPSTKRDRYLYIKTMNSHPRDVEPGRGGSNSYCNPDFLKIFEGIEGVEALSIAEGSPRPRFLQKASEMLGVTADARGVNEGFWQVFDFKFIAGGPFTRADVQGGIGRAVISDRLARQLFDNGEALGQQILVDQKPLTICGVVRNVSSYLQECYSDMWYPNTFLQDIPWDDNCGASHACFLVEEGVPFDAIHDSVQARVAIYNAPREGRLANIKSQPYGQRTFANAYWSNQEPDMKAKYRSFYTGLAIILLIPAVNLMAVASARMRRRQMELGVRKAYGAQTRQIVGQMFNESLVQTIIGGAIGLILAVLMAYATRGNMESYSYLSTTQPYVVDTIPFSSLVSGSVFLITLGFCFLINTIAVVLPSWIAARRPIVESLNVKK